MIIIFLIHFPENENHVSKASRDMDVAIVEIGYGDGLTRCVGNGVGKVLINGQLARIVGEVGMNMSMVWYFLLMFLLFFFPSLETHRFFSH